MRERRYDARRRIARARAWSALLVCAAGLAGAATAGEPPRPLDPSPALGSATQGLLPALALPAVLKEETRPIPRVTLPRLTSKVQRELQSLASRLPSLEHLELTARSWSVAYENLFAHASPEAWNGLRDAVRETIVEGSGLAQIVRRARGEATGRTAGGIAGKPSPVGFVRGSLCWSGGKAFARWRLSARPDGVVKFDWQRERAEALALRLRHDALGRLFRVSLAARF